MTMNLADTLPRNGGELLRRIELKIGPKVLLLIFGLLTTFALASDVSGKWNGTLEFKGEDGQAQTVPAHAELKQQNNVVVGRVWKEDGERYEIEQGRVSGNEISFTFRAPESGEEEVVHSVKLSSVSPTRMEGTLEFDGGSQKFSGKLTFTREK